MVFKASFCRKTCSAIKLGKAESCGLNVCSTKEFVDVWVQNGSTVCRCACEESYVLFHCVVESHQFTLLNVEDVSTKYVNHCETHCQTQEKCRNVMRVDDASTMNLVFK